MKHIQWLLMRLGMFIPQAPLFDQDKVNTFKQLIINPYQVE